MKDAHYGFDPDVLIPLDPTGTLYPTLEATGPWGKLEAKDGAVITSDFRKIIVAAPKGGFEYVEGSRRAGILRPRLDTFAQGRLDAQGGPRAGDYVVVRQ